jgi:DNA polymerase III sliding clamp (beta) subunit (PCNA family)
MKATIDTKVLRNAMEKAALVGRRRNIIPIVNNFLLKFADRKATIICTDLERMAIIEMEAITDEPFDCLLPPETARQFLKGKNGTLTLELKNGFITLERPELGKLRLRQNGKPEDYPPLQLPAADIRWLKLDAQYLCQMMNTCIPFCATEETRPKFNGVCFYDGALVATDGFRLIVVKSTRLEFGLGIVDGQEGKQPRKALLPLPAAMRITRLFVGEEEVEVAWKEEREREITTVFFRSGGMVFISHVGKADVRDFSSFIPKTTITKASFSVPLMLQRLDMIDERQISGGTTRLLIETTKTGEEICKIKALCGEDELVYEMDMPVKIESDEKQGRIAFNSKYLREMLRCFSTCTIELISSSQPGKFTGDLEGVTVMIMPMFVQWEEKGR